MRFVYSAEQLEFLRYGFRTMRVPALTSAFNKRFNLEKTPSQIKSALQNHGIRSGRAPGLTQGEAMRIWTQEHIAWVRDAYTRLSLDDMTIAFNLHFNDSKTVQQMRSLTRNHKIKSGRSGRFDSGHQTWNKGLKGLQIGGRETQFKPGHAPANVRPLGSERTDKDGYTLIKVSEPNPHTGASTRFRYKHVVVWESEHGHVPEGYVVSFKDGNKANCSLENLELLSRAALCYLNKNSGNLPDELRPSMRALAKLKAATSAAEREAIA